MQKIKREEGIEVEFDFFYNRDGDRFSYYMLPKIYEKPKLHEMQKKRLNARIILMIFSQEKERKTKP